MKKYSAMLAVAAMLASTGMASAQSCNYDSPSAREEFGLVAAQRRRFDGLFDDRIR